MLRTFSALVAGVLICAGAAADITGRRASTILGLDVFGPGGVSLGEVKDLLVAIDGSVALIVFAEHDVAADGEAMAVPWNFAEVGERAVRVRGSRFMRLEFGGSTVAGWSIAAVTGAPVQLRGDMAWGRVADAVLDDRGHVTHLVVTARNGERHVLPMTRLAVDREREEVTIVAEDPLMAESPARGHGGGD